jgi:diguanylate cyclase (GGDEF)-like protein
MTTSCSDGPDGRLGVVARAVCAALDLWSADVWTLTPEGDALVCRGFWSREEGGAARGSVGLVISLAQSHDLRRLVLVGEAIEHHSDEPDISPADEAALRAQRLQSHYDVPLRLGDEVLGVLSLGERRCVRRLDDAERDLLDRLSEMAAVALREDARAQLSDEHGCRLLDLVRSGQEMVVSLRVQTTIASATSQIVALFPGVECAVEVPLLRDDGSYARVVPSLGDEVELGASYEAAPADALAKQAVRQRRREQERARDGRARLVVPLLSAERALGYIDVRALMSRGFRDREAELIELMADQVATALVNARVLRSLEQRVATDAQTGLYGRWYFYERLAAEAARSRRYSQPLSLLVAEIDDLERVVAARGRVAGEHVLRAVARIVQSCLRDKVDVPCRHGSASFAVLLPSTMAAGSGAGLVAERLREVAAGTEVGDDELGRLGRFTLSIGVAGFPLHSDDADELASLAEEAVAVARRQGGDRVVFAGRG